MQRPFGRRFPSLAFGAVCYTLGIGAGGGPLSGTESSLRFFGNGIAAPTLDRVTIALDAPHRPVDVGGAFTVEWWMRALAGENASGGCTASADNWITGNILLDRDIYGGGDHGDWGVSLHGGVIAFGTAFGSDGAGICSTSELDDGEWHHVAVTRAADGTLRVFADGVLEGTDDGPAGDLSYRDGREINNGWIYEPFLVLGAEKHDAGAAYPSYSGWLDELRVSAAVRYTAAFTPPSQPFTPDASTAALFHFDEGSGGLVRDASTAVGGPSDGERRFGGDPAGPLWSGLSPFAPPCATVEHAVVEDETIAGAAEYGACSTVTVGPTVSVEATATVALRARLSIAFRGDLTVAAGAQLVATIDPAAGAP